LDVQKPEIRTHFCCRVAAAAATPMVADMTPPSMVKVVVANPSLWTGHLTFTLARSHSLSLHRAHGCDWLCALRRRRQRQRPPLPPFLSPSLSRLVSGVVWLSGTGRGGSPGWGSTGSQNQPLSPVSS